MDPFTSEWLWLCAISRAVLQLSLLKCIYYVNVPLLEKGIIPNLIEMIRKYLVKFVFGITPIKVINSSDFRGYCYCVINDAYQPADQQYSTTHLVLPFSILSSCIHTWHYYTPCISMCVSLYTACGRRYTCLHDVTKGKLCANACSILGSLGLQKV